MARGLTRVVFSGPNATVRALVILLLALFVCALLFTKADGEMGWTSTRNLGSARAYATATLLPDGHVLLVGGHGCNQDLASVELYDTATDGLTFVSSLHSGRANHTATLLRNGLVLVAGGQFEGRILSSAELYNPSTKTWSDTDSLHMPRAYHTATLLPNGQVLVVGGTATSTPPLYPQGAQPGSTLQSAELYDPASGKWTVTGSLHLPRLEHSATLLQNGDVLVAGGLTTTNPGNRPQPEAEDADFSRELTMRRFWGGLTVTPSTELYDPETEKWTSAGNMGESLFAHTATLLPNGEVLVAGGKPTTLLDSANAELYNPATKAWKQTGTLHSARNSHSATLMPDGHVLVVGGANDPDGVLTRTEIFDPRTEIWAEAPALKSTHSLHTATLLPDGRVFVAGGCYALGAPNFIQASAEVYGPVKPGVPEIVPNQIVNSSPPSPPPPPAPVIVTHLTPPFPPPPPPSILMMTSNLVVVTLCVVIITGCVLVLMAAWLVLIVVRRWGK